MHSSTSSSNARIPRLRYRMEWCCILLCLVGFVVGSELFYRSLGHWTYVLDSKRLWALHRADVYTSGGKKRIVIAGGSRAQLGLVPNVMGELFPHYRVKQLSIDGAPSYHIVKDLCEDPDFDGTILWSVMASTVFPAESDGGSKDLLYSSFFHNDFWKADNWEDNLNCYLGAVLQDNLVILSPHLSIRKLTDIRGRLNPNYISMNLDRYRPGRYRATMSDTEQRKHREERIERARAWFEKAVSRQPEQKAMHMRRFKEFLAGELSRLHGRLRARGGEMVMLRMPTTGRSWEMDEERGPQQLFWDRIHELSGIPTIHFHDYPNLRSFDCPDTSHLDWSDAPEFTRRLSRILKDQLEANGIMCGDPVQRPGPPTD